MRRTGVVLFAVLAVVTGACSNGGSGTQKVSALAPNVTSSTSSTTTASTTTTTTPDSTSATIAAKRIQRVRTLPASEGAPRPAKAPKAAASRGPTPTGRIAIPRIGLDHLTYEGIDLATIDHGPSHWPGTALPGQVGNTVFPGHRVTNSRPFFNIDLIAIGDTVTFANDTGRFTYQVTEKLVVDDSDTWIANPTDTPTMTIFACHPKGSAKQRYVVKGKLVKSERNAGAPANSGGTGSYETAPDPSAPATPDETTTTTQPSGGVKFPQIGK